MYPYIEVFGIQISMMVAGTIIATIIFLVTARILTKRNHQDFLKLFYRLPWRVILSYILWRYTAFALETWIYFPNSLSNTSLSLVSISYNIAYPLTGIIFFDKDPAPGPISITSVSLSIPLSATILLIILSSLIKFCPNDGTKLNEITNKEIVPLELKSLPEGASISVNGEKITDTDYEISKSIAIDSEIIVIRRGKKKYYIGHYE